MNIPDLLNGILQATAAEAAAKAQIATLRAALEDEGRRRLAAEGAAPSWNAPQMGKVRLDPPGDWKATVADPAAWGSWVAQNHPTEAVAVVYLDAPQLEAALDALRFADVTPLDTRVEVRPAWATKYLEDAHVDVTEVGNAGTLEVERTFTVIDPVMGVVLDGVTANRSAAKLVVTLDRNRRTAAIEAAKADAATLLETTDEAPAADLAVLDSRRRELEARDAHYLAQVARVHGLGTSGTKAELAERIARAEQATGNVVEVTAPETAAAEANVVDPNAPTPDPITEAELDRRTEDTLGELIDRLMVERTAEDLKRACRARTLSVSGGKRDLAERLAHFGVDATDLTFPTRTQ